jgi:DNA primase
MYSQKTIDEVNNLDLVNVIEKYVKLTKSGANYKGTSPFVDEKTPSFVVSPAKNVWHCFSSGIGGNSGVYFVMKHKTFTWKEALNDLINQFNIIPEIDEERGDAFLQTYIRKTEIREVNQVALDWFQTQLLNQTDAGKLEFKKLPDQVIKQASRTTMEQIERFQIGFAPSEKGALYSHLLNSGIPISQILHSGLVTEKTFDDGNVGYYDFFQNRIMFPIYSAAGALEGFSGRAVDWKKGDKHQKVINSRGNELFNKSNVVLGLNLAKSDIIKEKKAIKVEGNFDVTAFHEIGLTNSFASLGTAFTEDQLTTLKRFSDKLILAIDDDAAGLKSVEKDLKLCIKNGVSVDVWRSLILGQDPFDFVKWASTGLSAQAVKDYFYFLTEDGIDFLAEMYFREIPDNDIRKRTEAQEKLVEVLATIPNQKLRNNYQSKYMNLYNITKNDVEQRVAVELAAKKAKELEKTDEDGVKLPSYLSEDQVSCFKEYGFYADPTVKKIGLWFKDAKYAERKSNCIIKPIFQAAGLEKSKYIVELTYSEKEVVKSSIMVWSNDAFVSQQALETQLSNKLCYFDGSKQNYQFLKRKLFTQFPVCQEIKIMGWQTSGFFAFANGISDGGSFKEVNVYGICIHGDRNYYIPAYSKVYSEENDQKKYKEDRKFLYRSSNVRFSEWSKLFNEVYYENGNGMIVISFFLAALFSDHIYSINNSFTYPYYYGVPKTGKTTIARSISAIFKTDTTPVNLSQATKVGLVSILQNQRNTIVHLDELTNSLPADVLQTLKGIYDRSGRTKGSIDDDKIIQTEILAPVQISGQPLPTFDQNAFFTRAILLRFSITQDKRTIEEKKLFTKLAKMEKEGLSNIISEVIQFRDYVVKNFEEAQFQLYTEVKHDLEGFEIDGRVQSNILSCATMVKLLGEKLGLPFTFEKYWHRAKDNIIDQSATIGETDELLEFFKIVEFMYADGRISLGNDFVIETKTEIKVRNGRAGFSVIQFDNQQTRLIHLCFSRIHPLYSKTRKEIVSEIGKSESELKDIMRMHKAFVGQPAVINFNGRQTSAYTFRLDDLPVTMEVIKPPKQENLPF